MSETLIVIKSFSAVFLFLLFVILLIEPEYTPKIRLAYKMQNKCDKIEERRLKKERRILRKLIKEQANKGHRELNLPDIYFPLLEKDSKNYYYLVKEGFNIYYNTDINIIIKW